MSIQAYVGLPRSGKSYNAVANVIVPALAQKRVVVTNIPLHMERVRELYPDADVREFPITRIQQEPGLIIEHVPHGCVLVMDEVWRLFPAGLKVNNVPQEFKSLLAEHGHMVDEEGNAIAITLVTQDLGQIANFAKLLVEQTFLHTKLSHLGADGSFRVRIFHGPVTGQSPPKSSELRLVLGRYEERIWRLYKSHTMSKAGVDGANEKPMDTRGNIWKRPGIIAAAVAACAVGWWSFAALGDIFGPGDDSPPTSASVANARPAAGPRTTRRVSSPSAPGRTFRVSVIMASSDPRVSYALLVDDHGESIWIPADSCMRDRLQWRCRYENKWWPLVAPWKPPVQDTRPINPAPWVSPATESQPAT